MDFGQNWVTVPLPEGQLGSLLVADDAVAKGIYVEIRTQRVQPLPAVPQCK